MVCPNFIILIKKINFFFNSFGLIYTTFCILNFGMSCTNVLLPNLCGNYASNQGSANRWCFYKKNALYGFCFNPFLELFIFLRFRESWISSNETVKPYLNLKLCAHNCQEVWHVVTKASIDILSSVFCVCVFCPIGLLWSFGTITGNKAPSTRLLYKWCNIVGCNTMGATQGCTFDYFCG